MNTDLPEVAARFKRQRHQCKVLCGYHNSNRYCGGLLGNAMQYQNRYGVIHEAMANELTKQRYGRELETGEWFLTHFERGLRLNSDGSYSVMSRKRSSMATDRQRKPRPNYVRYFGDSWQVGEFPLLVEPVVVICDTCGSPNRVDPDDLATARASM